MEEAIGMEDKESVQGRIGWIMTVFIKIGNIRGQAGREERIT